MGSRGCGKRETSVVAILFVILMLVDCFDVTLAGYFTFYLPNAIRPSGYKSLTKLIKKIDQEIDPTNENAADIRKFWTTIPTELPFSTCSGSLARFRPIAEKYSQIDYEFFIEPLREYRNYVEKFRDKIYPEGAKQSNCLPRIWHQELIRKQIELRRDKHELLLNNEDYKNMRQTMVDIWTNVKRSLEFKKSCIYMLYAWRQMAPDITEKVLEANLKAMDEMIEKLKKDEVSVVHKFATKDAAAMKKIKSEQERVAKGQ